MSGGTCTRKSLSASPHEQAVCDTQIALLQHFGSAIAGPHESPRRTSISTALGSARTDGRTPGVVWPSESPFFPLARVGPTHRRVPQPGAQGTDREHPQAGSCQTAKDDGGKPGVRFLARSKRGTRFRTASLLGGTRQRRRRFCSPWVGRDQGRRHCRWRSPDDRNWLWLEWHSVKLNPLGFKVLRRKTPAHRLILNNMISISLDSKPSVSVAYSVFYTRASVAIY